jgi:sulfur transfer protein SufE
MKTSDSPVDYQAALDQYRKEEHAPANPVHGCRRQIGLVYPFEKES